MQVRSEGDAHEASLLRAALAIAVGTMTGASLVTLFAVLTDLDYFREYGRQTDAALLVFTYAAIVWWALSCRPGTLGDTASLQETKLAYCCGLRHHPHLRGGTRAHYKGLQLVRRCGRFLRL